MEMSSDIIREQTTGDAQDDIGQQQPGDLATLAQQFGDMGLAPTANDETKKQDSEETDVGKEQMPLSVDPSSETDAALADQPQDEQQTRHPDEEADLPAENEDTEDSAAEEAGKKPTSNSSDQT